jgi:ornithine cyclodeaminase/alanine dehydrogenase-like protein (mu-crystallin family)
MCEIPPEVILQAVAPAHGHHHHKHAQQGGAIVVDSVEGCMREAGELIQAGVRSDEVVELGELVMLRRDAERRRQEKEAMDPQGVELASSTKGRKKGKQMDDDEKADQGLRDWLCKGNVIYKSVGIGLMDVVVGNELVDLADSRNVGVRVDDF